jgi:mRNA interferase HicA
MTGSEFLRKIKAVGKKRNVPVRFDTVQGDGSHGTLWYGNRRCTLKDRKKEIGAGLLAAMLAQLGLSKGDLK